MAWKTGAAEEIRILRLLRDFDIGLASDYLKFVNRIYSQAATNSLLSWISGGTRDGTPVGFRARLSGLPIHLLASHPISRFGRVARYDIWRPERNFCATLGIIPVYFAEFGIYTVLKLWNEPARRFFESDEAIPSDREVCWQFIPENGGCEFSGMNFLLKSNARDSEPSEGTTAAVSQYFTNGFWSYPRPGFTCSAHFLHSQASIRTVMKVSKSIYSIDRLEAGFIEKEPDNVPVTKARMWGLDLDAETPVMRPYVAVLASDIEDTIQRDFKNSDFFVNGVVSEFRRQQIRFHALTSVALYGTSSIELLESVIGLIALRNFERLGRPSFVGSLEDLRAATTQVLRVLHMRVRYGRTIGDVYPDLFELALKGLRPMLYTDGQKVFYYHPCLMSVLSGAGLASSLEANKEALICVLKMMDSMPEKRTPMGLRTMPESDQLVTMGYDKEAIIRCLLRANQFIELARIVRR